MKQDIIFTIDEPSANKSDFDLEVEKQIEEYLNSINFDDEPNSLLTPAMRRNRMKAELEKELELTEYSSFVNSGFKLLISEGRTYLEEKAYQDMYNNFTEIQNSLNTIDFNVERDGDFQKDLSISDETLESILKIAVEKFNQNRYEDSLALFIVLCMFIPSNGDYWYRAGIAAHRSENYDLALKLYDAANSVMPGLIAARLFSVECYLKCNLLDEALSEFEEAKKIKNETEVEPKWEEFIEQLNLAIKTH
jgi:tetratricopeptide (TPR) repeat protein